MPAPLDVESLFVAVGLDPILRGRPSLPKYKIDEAAKLPTTIRRRIARFLATDAFAEAKDVPPFDYKRVLAETSAKRLDDAQAAALHTLPLDLELTDSMGIMAETILLWANGIIPREDRPSAFGMVADEPGASTTADFRRVWQVAEDPLRVLDDLEDGSLSDDQVAALVRLYPAIYAEMRQAVTDANAALVARRGKGWEPSPTKAALLGVLRQEAALDLDLAAAVQAVYAKEEAAAQAPPPRAPHRLGSGKVGDPEGGLTPGQAASDG